MSISFSGLASGLPVNDIIDQLLAIESRSIDLLEQDKSDLQTKRTYIDNIENRLKNVKTSVQKFTDGNLISSMDLFKKKNASSSDTSVATVSAGSNAVNQSFDLNVVSVATATKVESNGSGTTDGGVANLATGTTAIKDLANGTGTAGDFTVFYNNQEYTVTVNDTDTVDDVLTNISGIGGGGLINASITGGKITLASAGGGTINVGASGDTSNFLESTKLSTGELTGNDITSKGILSAVKTSGTIMGTGAGSANLQAGGAINAGTITIGTASFDIDASTTLDSLLNEINGNAKAGVTANYNINTNKIEFVSKTPGKVAVSLDDGGTGFLDGVNLISGADKLAYQTLGSNAKIKINDGPEIESTSNTVKASVTGLKDLTLTLLDDSAGQNISISVQQDTKALTDAMEKFVTEYNNTIQYIDEQTDHETGRLAGDSSLVRIRSNLRYQTSNYISGHPLSSLASIGLTTGEIGMEGEATSKLKFDKEKFMDALNENPQNVRSLMIGDSTEGITGIFETMYDYMESTLDPTNGFFATRDDSINNQIEDIDKSIERQKERLSSREAQLKQQFAAMEQSISTMKSQSSYMGAQLGALM